MYEIKGAACTRAQRQTQNQAECASVGGGCLQRRELLHAASPLRAGWGGEEGTLNTTTCTRGPRAAQIAGARGGGGGGSCGASVRSACLVHRVRGRERPAQLRRLFKEPRGRREVDGRRRRRRRRVCQRVGERGVAQAEPKRDDGLARVESVRPAWVGAAWARVRVGLVEAVGACERRRPGPHAKVENADLVLVRSLVKRLRRPPRLRQCTY